jgi:hypothetical protein
MNENKRQNLRQLIEPVESHNKQFRRVNWTPECKIQGEEGSDQKEKDKVCHDESWYQLKHGLQVCTIIKVCLTSPPSPREKEATAPATPKRRWLRQV